MSLKHWEFYVDRGGTFTDVIAYSPVGKLHTCKLLSNDENHYDDATIEGIRRLLKLRDDQAIPVEKISSLRVGTTLATNALLERKGAPVALITSAGFRDALTIGFQQRPDLFALHIEKPKVLYHDVIETTQRQNANGDEIQPLNELSLIDQLRLLKKQGIVSIAIALMHSYKNPTAEQRIKQLAMDQGFEHVICSHESARMIGYVLRGNTTVIDAYLTPLFSLYIEELKQQLPGVALFLMQSNGGLLKAQAYRAKDSLLSGPAGGVIAGAKLSQQANLARIVTFDMGGTSTDVAYYSGKLNRHLESTIQGFPAHLTMLDIETIAAGGGSIIHFHQGRFSVGPQSAGANPGPACYGKGGPLTITDCHVLLGTIRAEFFPHCFGLSGDQAINVKRVVELFDQLTKQINRQSNENYTPNQVALGFIRVAVMQMASAIKKVSLQQGHDITEATLCSFGGASGQHVCAVANELGLGQVMISPFASLLSALGIGMADLRTIKYQTIEGVLSEVRQELDQYFEALIASMDQPDFLSPNVMVYKTLQLKYQGTDTTVDVYWGEDCDQQFMQQYRQVYGFTMPQRNIVVASISVEWVLENDAMQNIKPPADQLETINKQGVIYRSQMEPNRPVVGPLLIVESHTVTDLLDGWQAELDVHGNLMLSRLRQSSAINVDTKKSDPIWLEVFNYLFMSIAEEMGEALANTAYSVNIKERRDFSCALFDVNGDLVANAPHMPVHLGSMGVSVKAVMKHFASEMSPGNVYLLNDPYHGGTHLPDMTVITPIFLAADRPSFYVASRGHHADIGGSQPGSMPADSTHIEQEGILFTYAVVVVKGEFQQQALVEWFEQKPYPARNVEQNLADLRAQIAANQRGVVQVEQMVQQYSLPVVNAYMQFVQRNAEQAVRDVVACLKDGEFTQHMDCGAQIHVRLTVDQHNHQCVIDFSGTHGAEVSNFNAPKAVTTAAVLYVFRCLVQQDMPLNEGCLKPIKIIIPEGCLLDPKWPRPVVAGNVETSQNVVEALFSAMGVMAQSQATMNNLTFGNQHYQYYETIAGGSGAGEGFHGADAVQVHMTNTRLTDPEVLECRFPVLLQTFHLRADSGGNGRFCGGNGVVRRFCFNQSMRVNLLSEHRMTAPRGMQDGEDGKCGENCVIRANGERQVLSACAAIDMEPGDMLVIHTPGGGGYGQTNKEEK